MSSLLDCSSDSYFSNSFFSFSFKWIFSIFLITMCIIYWIYNTLPLSTYEHPFINILVNSLRFSSSINSHASIVGSLFSYYPKNNNPNTNEYMLVNYLSPLDWFSINTLNTALITSSLVLPTNINPMVNAVMTYISNLLFISITNGTMVSMNSSLQLPA